MLVVRVFLQKYGQDYNEVHTLVARIEIIILIIAVVFYNNWLMYHLDVKSAFLNAEL